MLRSVQKNIKLSDIVNVQFELSDKLCLQRHETSRFWRHRIEREIGLLRTNFASSRGQTMGKVTAATVEFLCERYDVPCPQWVHDPRYTLEIPWWYTERADDPKIQERLIQITPTSFARRKIFCGNRLF